MAKLTEWLKWAFPKPNIPQKRYIVMFFMLVYPALHMYVEHTQADWDNKALEAVKTIVLTSFNEPDAPSNQYDDNGMRYGEGA